MSTPDWLLDQPIAHRGLHDERIPENTLEAFEAAASAGLAVELDVRRAGDGTLVVHHDVSFARLTGVQRLVKQATRDEIRALRVAGGSTRIPELEDVLDLVAGRVPVLIDIKNESIPGALEHALMDRLSSYEGPHAVQSFNPLVLAWFAKRSPAIPRGQLASDLRETKMPRLQRFALRRMLLNPLSRPHFVGYALDCLPYWAPNVARRFGKPLLAWTVRTPRDHERALRLADNYIFEGLPAEVVKARTAAKRPPPPRYG